MIAALFVETGGVYSDLPDVDAWDHERDARLYAGPWAVICHPPCERWGRYWFGGPSARVRLTKGDDHGCFAAALAAVRRWGGVLEHPEASHAWPAHGLNDPPKSGGWVVADWFGGWTCCVEQGHYGHRARKATWLYAVGVDLPELRWGPATGKEKLDDGHHTSEDRLNHHRRRTTPRPTDRERAATPIPFRDLLLDMARSVRVERIEAAS